LLAVNLGTGTPESAVALVEYCNLEKGTRWSDLRRQHGIEKPYGVKYWCLGNEMDVPHQIGNMPATEYGRKVQNAARQMRIVDPSLQLIACGSTVPLVPTYLEWDRQVLEESYDEVDGISTHRYFGNEAETGGDTRKYLALNLLMDRQIEEVAAICDTVQARKRSSKRLWLSFDEWNVWYRAIEADDVDGRQKEAPPLLEEVYNLEDALLVAGVINTLLRHADRVRVGCLAQLVNVIAPLMTNADSVLRQTIYYPYAWALKYAHGDVLDVALESETYEVGEIKGPSVPSYARGHGLESVVYKVAQIGRAPYIDAVATMDPDTGTAALLILNRDLAKSRDLEVVWRENPPKRVLACEVLTGNDLKAFNSFEAPNRVVPQPLEPPKVSSRMTFQLPPRSYTAVNLATI
jgi:alpha-N-arabinofuranosidase